MNKEDFERILNNLKMRFNDMDFYSYIDFLKRVEKDIYHSLLANNPMGLDPETFTNGRILNYLLEDKEFSSKVGDKIKSESVADPWRYFRGLLDGKLELDTLLNLFRDENLLKIAEDKYHTYKLLGALCEKDTDRVIRFALQNETFYTILKEISIKQELTLYVVDYETYKMAIEKDIEFGTRAIRASSEQFNELIEDKTLPNGVLIEVLDKCYIEGVLTNFFQNNPRRNDMFEAMSKSQIRRLIDKGVKFSVKLGESPKIINALASESIVDFRASLNRYEENNPSSDIESKVEKEYDKLLSTYNPETGMFKEYEEMLKQIETVGWIDYKRPEGVALLLMDNELYKCRTKEDFIRLSEKKLKEIVTDYLFKDNAYNIDLNIQELDRYESHNTQDNIGKSRALKAVIKVIKEKSGKDLIEALEVFKELGVGEVYYDAIRGTKNKVNSEIESAVTKDKLEPSKELSEKYGVTVYDLMEKKHFTLVRAMGSPYREDTINERDCYTLISDENTTTIHDGEYLYGYDDFDHDYIMHVFEGDAFSSSGDKETTKYVNRLMTPHDIVTLDDNISEIQIKNRPSPNGRGYITIRPTCVIAKDEIREQDIEEAKRLGVPIKLIKSKKLVKATTHTLYDDDKTYVTSSFDESRRVR